MLRVAFGVSCFVVVATYGYRSDGAARVVQFLSAVIYNQKCMHLPTVRQQA